MDQVWIVDIQASLSQPRDFDANAVERPPSHSNLQEFE
jgi:hypothetical protein